jgi:small GTP-binding protein
MDLIVDRRGGTCYKVVLLGDSQVGKTSIIACQLQNRPPDAPMATVGCHCSEIAATVDGRQVVLQVWDTAGQEAYRSLVPVYLRGARAALLVYDVTEQISFDSVPGWHELLQVVHSGAAIFLVANKIDLAAAEVVKDERAMAFARQFNFHFFRVSAVTGHGITELFDAVARTVSTQKQEVLDRVPVEAKKPTTCAC